MERCPPIKRLKEEEEEEEEKEEEENKKKETANWTQPYRI